MSDDSDCNSVTSEKCQIQKVVEVNSEGSDNESVKSYHSLKKSLGNSSKKKRAAAMEVETPKVKTAPAKKRVKKDVLAVEAPISSQNLMKVRTRFCTALYAALKVLLTATQIQEDFPNPTMTVELSNAVKTWRELGLLEGSVLTTVENMLLKVSDLSGNRYVSIKNWTRLWNQLEEEYFMIFTSLGTQQTCIKLLSCCVAKVVKESSWLSQYTSQTQLPTTSAASQKLTQEDISTTPIYAPGIAQPVDALDFLFGEGTTSSMYSKTLPAAPHTLRPLSSILKRNQDSISSLKLEVPYMVGDKIVHQEPGDYLIESRLYEVKKIMGVPYMNRSKLAVITTRAICELQSPIMQQYKGWVQLQHSNLIKRGAKEKQFQEQYQH